jgi:hypothetical protein
MSSSPSIQLSPNTQAVLLLTAPFIAGRAEGSSDLLTAGEYQRLAQLLNQMQRQPADLLNSERDEFPNEWKTIIDAERFKRLLGRGFQLAEAVERWQTRAIWVVSFTDEDYYDPSAGFNVGHAMQRNKLIYALADAALVVNSDYEKGGTWAGAVEQLEKLHLVPLYVRTDGEAGKGLEALRRKGASPWPNPPTPEAYVETLAGEATGLVDSTSNRQLSFLEP